MGQAWLAVTNLPAQRQSTRTQLYKNQVWVFGCQISQLLQRDMETISTRQRRCQASSWGASNGPP